MYLKNILDFNFKLNLYTYLLIYDYSVLWKHEWEKHSLWINNSHYFLLARIENPL